MTEKVTLSGIKARRLVEVAWKGYMDVTLSEWNIRVCRERMKTKDGIRLVIADLRYSGNEPMSNEEMLDRARWYVEKEVFTDEQWEKYLLVDKDHTEENIAKVREYHVSKGHIVPHYLDSRIERMYYR